MWDADLYQTLIHECGSFKELVYIAERVVSIYITYNSNTALYSIPRQSIPVELLFKSVLLMESPRYRGHIYT